MVVGCCWLFLLAFIAFADVPVFCPRIRCYRRFSLVVIVFRLVVIVVYCCDHRSFWYRWLLIVNDFASLIASLSNIAGCLLLLISYRQRCRWLLLIVSDCVLLDVFHDLCRCVNVLLLLLLVSLSAVCSLLFLCRRLQAWVMLLCWFLESSWLPIWSSYVFVCFCLYLCICVAFVLYLCRLCRVCVLFLLFKFDYKASFITRLVCVFTFVWCRLLIVICLFLLLFLAVWLVSVLLQLCKCFVVMLNNWCTIFARFVCFDIVFRLALSEDNFARHSWCFWMFYIIVFVCL